MRMKVTDTRGYCNGCGEAKAIRRAVPRKTKVKSRRPLQRVCIGPTGPYPQSRAPFVGEVPTWGNGAVMDAAAAAVASTAATVTGNGVFPAASAKGAGRCACVCSCSSVNSDRQWSLPRCVGEGGGWCACVCSCSGSIGGGHCDGGGGGGGSGDSAGWGEEDGGSARRCVPHASGGLDNCTS